MKKTLLIIVLVVAFFFVLSYSYMVSKNKKAIIACNSLLIEQSDSRYNSLLNAHVSILINTKEKWGELSLNGNVFHLESVYKIKRKFEFNFSEYKGNYMILNLKNHITSEDDTPNSVSKHFNITSNDIAFNIYGLSKNKDGSYTIYNSHEPVLTCGK